MHLNAKIRSLLSDEDIAVLESHGQTLEALVSGDMVPVSDNQKCFVRSIKENQPVLGTSAKVWTRYCRVRDLVEQNQTVLPELDRLKSLNDKLATEVEAFTIALNGLEEDGKHDTSLELCDDVMSQMSPQDRHLFELFAGILVLHKTGLVAHEAFEAFSKKSGVWRAVRNYEKIKNSAWGTFDSGRRKLTLEKCAACGSAIVNGHCKCSR